MSEEEVSGAAQSTIISDVRVTPNEYSWVASREFSNQEIDELKEKVPSELARTYVDEQIKLGRLQLDRQNRRWLSRHVPGSDPDQVAYLLRRVAQYGANGGTGSPEYPLSFPPHVIRALRATGILATQAVEQISLAEVEHPLVRDLEAATDEMFATCMHTPDDRRGYAGLTPDQVSARLHAKSQHGSTQIWPPLRLIAQLISAMFASAALGHGLRHEISVRGSIASVDHAREALETSLEQARSAEDQRTKKLEERLTELEERHQETVKKQMVDLARLRDEAAAVLKACRTTSTAAALSSFQEVFGERADQHKNAARAWLSGAAALLVTFVILAAVGIYLAPEPPLERALLAWAPRAALGLVILSAAAWCGRVYGVHRHNEIVLRHKLAALSTFEIMVSGAPTAEVRGAVVVAATAAIYALHPTTPDGHADPNLLVASEVIRAGTQSKHSA